MSRKIGAGALIPQVNALRAYFPGARLLQYEDPKDGQLAVARGASLHALALVRTGRGIVEPVAQDDIYLATQQGHLKLVERGARLPLASGQDCLVVPENVFEGQLRLSLELVAGDERRLLERTHWDLQPVVCKGSPLRLDYTYDENQELHLELRLAQFPESVPFEVSIENPLSHVVNPNATQEEIDRLEEEYRRNPRNAEELIPRVAELCAELGQHDKAVGMIRALLRQTNRPVAWLLNRQAMYEEARGNHSAAIRSYEEAARASPNWAGPLFNLALLHDRQHDYDAALRVIDRAIQQDHSAPYQTLKLRILVHSGSGADLAARARRVLADFGDPAVLEDWQLGWFLDAARFAGDHEATEAGLRVRNSRRQSTQSSDGGIRPDMRRMD